MENKYPYIGRNSHGIEVLIYSDTLGRILCGVHEGDEHKVSKGWFERRYANITADYLRNTKIRIESPEHSAFVQKLVFSADGGWFSGDAWIKNINSKYIFINQDLMMSHSSGSDTFNNDIGKEIKLPMPPSQLPEVSSETPMPKVNPPKEGGLNLNPNCALNPIHDGLNNCKVNEWPKVGDEVMFSGDCIYKVVINKPDNDNMIVVIDGGGDYNIADFSSCRKPPTQKERLARLIHEFGGTDTNYCENLAKAILAGEIEGLVYKGG